MPVGQVAVLVGVCPNLDLTLEVVGSKSGRSASCSCPLGRCVDDGRLVMIWVVPVSSFGLSGLMRISEEKKNSVSFRSVSFIYVNTYSS